MAKQPKMSFFHIGEFLIWRYRHRNFGVTIKHAAARHKVPGLSTSTQSSCGRSAFKQLREVSRSLSGIVISGVVAYLGLSSGE